MVAIACAACAPTRQPSARELFKRARKFEKKGDVTQAYLLYAQAAAADPSKNDYWQRSQALRTRAAMAAKVMPADDASAPAAPTPEVKLPAASEKESDEARRPQPPFELKGSGERKSFDLKTDSKALFEQVAKAYGLEVVFDGDYQSGPPIRFQLANADYREALYAVSLATSSFIVPIGDRLFMAAKDSEQKRKEVEVTVAVMVPIPEPVTVQEAQEMARSVQQLMEIQRFAIDSAQRAVLIRDRVSKVRPAVALLHQLLVRHAQIIIEVELISVAKNTSLRYGLSLPSAFPIEAIIKTLTLGGGASAFAVGIAGAEALATYSRSFGTSLLHADLRSSDGQAATMHAGEKYPIQTVGYFGDTSSGGQVYTPPPTFNFEDLGLTLKVTPKVHDSAEVSLDVEAEYKLLTGSSVNGIPIISNRKFANRVRLRFDQAAIVAGLFSSTKSKNSTSPFFLGGILGQTTRTTDDAQLLLVLKPRLIDLPASEQVSKEMWIGTESRPLSPL